MTGQINPLPGSGRHLCLYSPARVSLVDKTTGEAFECVYDAAAAYESAIARAMAKFRTEEYPENDLMLYFAMPDDLPMERTIKEKIQSARLTAHVDGETLYAALDLTLSADLTDLELEAFQEQIKAQYRDGWGAAFELTNIPAYGPCDICMRLFHDGLEFFVADAFDMRQKTAVFYCPLDVHLFPGITVDAVILDEELSENRDLWDAALVKTPQDYAEQLDRALQNYRGGRITLDGSPDLQCGKVMAEAAHCSVVERGDRLWLAVECLVPAELSSEEMNQLQGWVAASIAEESMTARWPDQWGWLNTDAGALIIRPQPVEDWSFSTNGYQPSLAELVEDNHLLTAEEWLSLPDAPQPKQEIGWTTFRM